MDISIEKARSLDFLKKPVDVAIDIHDWLYYGKKNDWVLGTKPRNCAKYTFKHITASIVSGKAKLHVAVLPMETYDYAKKLTVLVLGRLRKELKIRIVYLDRHFYHVAVVEYLKRLCVKFVMQAPEVVEVRAVVGKNTGKVRVVKGFHIKWYLTLNYEECCVNLMEIEKRGKYDKRGKSVIMRVLELTCTGTLSVEMGLVKEHRVDVYAEVSKVKPRIPIERDSWLEIIISRIMTILKKHDKAYVLCEFYSTQPRPESLWSILFETMILIDLKIPRVNVWNVLPIVILSRISEGLINFLLDRIGLRISDIRRETKYLLVINIAGIRILLIEYEKLPDNPTNAILKMLSPRKEIAVKYARQVIRSFPQIDTFIIEHAYNILIGVIKMDIKELEEYVRDEVIADLRETIETYRRMGKIELAVKLMGKDKFAEVIDIDKFIEEEGIDRLIELIGVDITLERIGVERFLKLVGPERFIELIGADRALKLIGPEKLLESLGPEKFIELIGVGHCIDFLGITGFMEFIRKHPKLRDYMEGFINIIRNCSS